MVYHNTSIPNSIDHQSTSMAVSMSLTDAPSVKSKQISQFQKNKKPPNSSINHQIPQTCCESRLAVLDMIMLIAAIGAIGFLLFPYVNFTCIKIAEISTLVFSIMKDEISENPIIYGCLGFSMVCVAMAAWAIILCTTRKCGNSTCRGLWKAAEFDIQLETEECVKNSNSNSNSTMVKDGGIRKGLFELPRDHHRELEAELKKIAPANGRAVLVFRARCGCSVGRMEVPGPRKARKMKK